ncbi:hypothetical protein [Nocardia sp. CWNU-33]|uniref:hypothetical protein n=1 Tax=Nocardia sp. CWNU-33 TaxID=3392117 RepID=UPI00398EEC07
MTSGKHTITVDEVPANYHVAGQGPVCVLHPGGPGFEHSGHIEQSIELRRAVVDFVRTTGE